MRSHPKPVTTEAPAPAIVAALPVVRPPRDVLDDACRTYGVTIDALVGPCRSRWLTKARTAAAIELRALGLSLADIGGILNRHHTSILYLLGGVKR